MRLGIILTFMLIIVLSALVKAEQFDVFHNETSTSTCSNTGGCNALQLLFKPTTTGAYVIFASGAIGSDDANPDILLNVTINTTSPALTIGHMVHDSTGPPYLAFHRYPINAIKQINLTANNVYNISMTITPSTANNAFLDYARIIVFNPNVTFYAENDSRVDTTGADDVQFLENNFTVTEAGDYLVLWSAVGNSTGDIEGRLTVRWNGSATSSIGYANYSAGNGRERFSIGGFSIQSMAAGAHRINMSFTRIDADPNGTVALQHGRVLVMPLSIFPKRYFVSDNRTTQTNSNVSYVNNTYTPTANMFHIKLASYQYLFGDSSDLINVTVLNRTDSHPVLSTEVVDPTGGTVNARSSLFFWAGNLTGEQNDTVNSTRLNGTGNAWIREARLLALELPVPFSSADATPPTITFIAPTPANGTYSVNYVYVNVTATDASNIINACILEWNGVNESMTMNSSVSGTSRFCFVNKTGLADGNYSYRVFANDSLNNTAASATRHVNVDTARPILTFQSPTPVNNTYIASYVYVNMSVNDTNAIDTCTLEWNSVNESMTKSSAGQNIFCFVNKTGLSDANYTYRVFANDSAGNLNASATRHANINVPISISSGYNILGRNILLNFAIRIGSTKNENITVLDNIISAHDGSLAFAIVSANNKFGTALNSSYSSTENLLQVKQGMENNRFLIVFANASNETIHDRLSFIKDRKFPGKTFGTYIEPSVGQFPLYIRLQYEDLNIISRVRFVGSTKLIIRNEGRADGRTKIALEVA